MTTPHKKPHHRTHGKHVNTTRRNRHDIRKLFISVGTVLIVVEFLLLQASLRAADTPLAGVSMDQNLIPKTPSLRVHKIPPGDPDGIFNGYPVYYQNVSAISYTHPYSLMNCLGENYQAQDWMHRSCHFRFMCFNISSRQFEVYQRPEDTNLKKWARQVPLLDVTETYIQPNNSMSLGGINLKWSSSDIPRLQWFPNIVEEPPSEFYSLPDHVVLIPYHSLAGWNPGHLVWDDFLPIFTLLDLFPLTNDPDWLDRREVLPIRYVPNGTALWASCDAKVRDCQAIQTKFWPLLNNHSKPTTQLHVHLKTAGTTTKPLTNLVCAKNAMAGLGVLTDHGTNKLHGWLKEDYETTHNHGRGGQLWRFRSFCLRNLGMEPNTQPRQAPYRIVFSVQSSSVPQRNLDFNHQEHALQEVLPTTDATTQQVVFRDMSLEEQVQLATETSIFVTGCGGGAVTATFLPKGATLIIYYKADGGRRHNTETGLPARLDWDLFNHMSYLNVHWFPSGTMDNSEDMEALVDLVQNDLARRNARATEGADMEK